MLGEAFIHGIEEYDRSSSVTKIYLRDLNLEHFTLEHYDSSKKIEKDFQILKDAILQADGIIIASPIWNFSVPAHLKNAIDRIGSFGLDADTRTKGQFKGKPFYFIFTGGAPRAAWRGLMRFTVAHVSESLRYFGGTIVGHYYEAKCTERKGVFTLVLDKRPESLAKVRAKGKKFAGFVEDFTKTGKLPLGHRFVTWVYAEAQRVMGKL